jgi:hypothetical protein
VVFAASGIAPVAPAVLGSAYGWGSIPLLSAYDAGTDLPVLPWNESVAAAAAALGGRAVDLAAAEETEE